MIPSVGPIPPFQPKAEKSSPKKDKVSNLAKDSIGKRAKDTSDIPSKKERIVTKAKAKEAGEEIKEYHKDLKEKNSVLWDCVDRLSDIYGGYLYVFRLKKEFDEGCPSNDSSNCYGRVLAINEEIYPAVEPGELPTDLYQKEVLMEEFHDYVNQKDPEGVLDDNGKYKLFEEFRKKSREYFFMEQLGYSTTRKEDGRLYFQIPDKKALECRFEVYRKQPGNEHLPSFNILNSEGIAGDLEFIEGHLTQDAILSVGKEYIHDQVVHIQPTFRRLLFDSKMEKKFKKDVFKLYKELLRKRKEIQYLKQDSSNMITLKNEKFKREDVLKTLKICEKAFSFLVDLDSSKGGFNDFFIKESASSIFYLIHKHFDICLPIIDEKKFNKNLTILIISKFYNSERYWI